MLSNVRNVFMFKQAWRWRLQKQLPMSNVLPSSRYEHHNNILLNDKFDYNKYIYKEHIPRRCLWCWYIFILMLQSTLKLMIKQHERYKKPGVNSDAPEWLAVPAPHVTPVVLLLNDTNIIRYENSVGHQYT
jgi:hypothetical protein